MSAAADDGIDYEERGYLAALGQSPPPPFASTGSGGSGLLGSILGTILSAAPGASDAGGGDAGQADAGTAAKVTDISEKGVSFIKAREGLRTKKYNDQAGYCTIGYGHLLHRSKCDDKDPSELPYKNGISEDQAVKLLKDDLASFVKTVKDNVSVDLTQYQFDALVSFQFNTGGLVGSTLLKRVNEKKFDQAAAEFKKWNKITENGKKVESDGLTKRRKAEEDLFSDGTY
jgi:GH24 family phage-related lysozyme (muramidase)